MRFSYANIRRLLAGVVIAGTLVSCGSSSNNNQGVSFTLLGYFASAGETDSTGETTTLPPGLTGLSITISDTDNEAPPSPTNFGGGTILAYVGTQNNIVTEFIRVDQSFIQYIVPGASAQPPSTNYALALTLGPGQSSSLTPPTSSLPGSFDGYPNIGYAQIPIISSDIRAWLNLNRGLLPEMPFIMTVKTVLSGVTSAGDRLYTNDADIFVQVNSDTIIAPTTPSGSSSEESAF
ncbi:MAG: hypothetical protein J0M12_12555 [Deltaproteobacteria bacterium]|nr:hypothetical protein [Deltaproteobacteria bacterium]